ncbi:NTP transferase domain-containing protein [Geobacter pelophilus]|uniref:NTP transferase domain-containing protein n=1 Tax=Geoanaerobacter pelophilus TaxID=60036 RepID=A0AAW4L2D2_9BACT|nr:NTP transferase domain-containing protein [Geoanaerobacter pelophilus]MBT0665146.1 NTP transferase domain-containing protein [Geoanaerobacter pelophilus]
MADKVAAIILAAGLSSRMKEFKPLLPLGRFTALERVILTMREAGVDDIRVVTGHRSPELEPVVAQLGAQIVFNRQYSRGMFSSVRAGVRSLGSDTDAFFALPVDLALVRPATVRRLLEVFRLGGADVIYPCFMGKRGHPPLIAGRHSRTISSWRGREGLRGVLAMLQTGALTVEVADELILRDMDTPDDYRSMAAMATRLDIPTTMECRALLGQVLGVDQRIIRHGQQVARLATELAAALNRVGCSLDLDLLSAAGLLHDLARHEKDHAMAGARILRELGFASTARLVASHMDLIVNESRPLTEAELLYLADKMVLGERQVSLVERFQCARSRHNHDPEALRRIDLRLETARIIQRRCEAQLGSALRDLLPGGEQIPVQHAG